MSHLNCTWRGNGDGDVTLNKANTKFPCSSHTYSTVCTCTCTCAGGLLFFQSDTKQGGCC